MAISCVCFALPFLCFCIFLVVCKILLVNEEGTRGEKNFRPRIEETRMREPGG